MKSKDLEALESIVVDLTPTAKEHNKKDIKLIKKDLEILEILKEHCTCIVNMLIIHFDLLNKQEHKKIEEWLEND